MKKEKELKASDEKKQMVVRQMREVQAENIGLQARDPEVGLCVGVLILYNYCFCTTKGLFA